MQTAQEQTKTDAELDAEFDAKFAAVVAQLDGLILRHGYSVLQELFKMSTIPERFGILDASISRCKENHAKRKSAKSAKNL